MSAMIGGQYLGLIVSFTGSRPRSLSHHPEALGGRGPCCRMAGKDNGQRRIAGPLRRNEGKTLKRTKRMLSVCSAKVYF
jgi:hypothetical protein